MALMEMDYFVRTNTPLSMFLEVSEKGDKGFRSEKMPSLASIKRDSKCFLIFVRIGHNV